MIINLKAQVIRINEQDYSIGQPSIGDVLRKAAGIACAPVRFFTRQHAGTLITAIAAFTVIDILLTYLGLKQGYLAELNPLMRHILQTAWIYLLPFYLLLCFAVLYHYAGRVRWLARVLAVVLVIKIIVMVQHLAVLYTAFKFNRFL